MEGGPNPWRSLFPWGQRVNLPAVVVKRPRLHRAEGVAIRGAPLPWQGPGMSTFRGVLFLARW